MHIKDELTKQIERWGFVNYPALIERFVLEFGTERLGSPFIGKKMKDKECFCNALHYSMKWDLLYVEGFAVRPNLGLLIHHAWCETKDGVVIDPTWRDPEECEYIGVAFCPYDVASHTTKTGRYGLYDSGFGIDIEFLNEEAMKRRMN